MLVRPIGNSDVFLIAVFLVFRIPIIPFYK